MTLRPCCKLFSAWQMLLKAFIVAGFLSVLAAPMHAGADPLEKYLTAEDFAKLFPHANHVVPVGADPNYYSYENMKNALEMSEKFAPFLNEGDETTKRLELAAILANWAQETTGGWADAPDGYTSWGLCFLEENQARSASNCYYSAQSPYQPDKAPAAPSDKCFFGRGPIQLSWNGNYGAFSEFLFGDPKILLNNPDKLLENGQNGFASGFWFWIVYRGSPIIRDTSCHDAMVEYGAKGFGKVINIVNGAIECNIPLQPFSSEKGQKIRHRADHFHYFADYLGVGDELPPRPEGKPADTPEWNEYYKEILVGCIE